MSTRKIGRAMTVSLALIISAVNASVGTALSGHFTVGMMLFIFIFSILFICLVGFILNKLLHSDFAVARIADAFMLTVGAKTKDNIREGMQDKNKERLYSLIISGITTLIYISLLSVIVLSMTTSFAQVSINRASEGLQQQIVAAEASLSAMKEQYNVLEPSEEKAALPHQMGELESSIRKMKANLSELQHVNPKAEFWKRLLVSGVPTYFMTWLLIFFFESPLMKLFTKKYGEMDSEFNQ